MQGKNITEDEDHILAKYTKAGAFILDTKQAFNEFGDHSPADTPVVWAEIRGPRTVEYLMENVPTHQAMEILTQVLPGVLELFLIKNKDYQEYSSELGAKGQFADIWRKVGKLKRALWDGEQLSSEQPPEIMMDMVGHLLLSLLELSGDNKS